MCFINHKGKLNELRGRKRPVSVWKTGSVDQKTGWVETQYRDFDVLHHVVWIPGQTVRPHKIREPLQNGHRCSAGLYFHTTTRDMRYCKGLVLATVEPKDIIGVSCDGQQLCCIAAKVTKTPNVDSRAIRMKFLRELVKQAEQHIAEREK